MTYNINKSVLLEEVSKALPIGLAIAGGLAGAYNGGEYGYREGVEG
jgi:hypothetical protein